MHDLGGVRRRGSRPVGAAILALIMTLGACGGGTDGGMPAEPDPPNEPAVAYAPGAAGIGDPYFPGAGNGGYDALHYDLDLSYDPEPRTIGGTATVRARSAADLSAFNLDLVGLTVRSVDVDGRAAEWKRVGQELTVTPARGIRKGSDFTTVVRYDGAMEAKTSADSGVPGFRPTRYGALFAGEPEVAATWFPVNDHPRDRAAYTFRISVPEGLQAIANGRLVAQDTTDGRTRWTWDAIEPMAPYLTTLVVGRFELADYTRGLVAWWDALDRSLLRRPGPADGKGFALTPTVGLAHRRIVRTLAVPAGGATLTFDIDRWTHRAWDHVFVEARTAGADDWTTLRDANGHTDQAPGEYCQGKLDNHSFLRHYLARAGEDGCRARGTTGAWWTATGDSEGYEQWSVDLSKWAGKRVEVAIASLDFSPAEKPAR